MKALVAPPPTQLDRGGLRGPDPLAHYLATLRSPRSRVTQLRVLTRCARELARLDGADPALLPQVRAESYAWGAPGALTYARVNAIIAIIAHRHVPFAASASAALHGLARAAFNLGLLDIAERQRIEDVRAPRLSASRRGRALTDREIGELYRACRRDARPLGRRDAALVAILLGAGLRRFEASALDVADYEPPTEERPVPYLVVRQGKGGKFARVAAPPDVARAVADWIAVRGDEPGALLCSSPYRSAPPLVERRLSPAGIWSILRRRALEAQIAPTAPHDLRRTMVTRLLETTGDLALAQRQARHDSPSTTARYDRRGVAALERVLEVASTGYVPR